MPHKLVLKMKKKIVTIVLLFQTVISLTAGETKKLSLKDCVGLAVEQNINTRTARIENEKSRYKKDETRAALLPKLNMSAQYTDNVALPTTVLPGEFLGKPGTTIAAQMGSQFSTTASLSLSQVLYSQTALTALQLSKKSEQLTGLSVEKASEEVAFEVARLYVLNQTTVEQQRIINENIKRTEKLQEITRLTVETGLGKQVDLDRVNVNLENLYTQKSNTDAALEQQINMIKYMTGISAAQEIALTDSVTTPLTAEEPVLISDFSDNVNIRMLESQKELNEMNKKLVNSGYMPTLSLSAQAAYQGLRNDFSTYFKSGSQNKWYPMANFAVTLSVPVFDGLEKRAKSRQASMDIRKSTETLENTKENYSVNYKNALNTYINNKATVKRQNQNVKLSEKVYQESSLKFSQGLATMSTLLQDEMSLSSAQSNYLTALYNLKEAELQIMSINGKIKNLYNTTN